MTPIPNAKVWSLSDINLSDAALDDYFQFIQDSADKLSLLDESQDLDAKAQVREDGALMIFIDVPGEFHGRILISPNQWSFSPAATLT